MWWGVSLRQWRSQRGGAVGTAATLAENPQLHCILLLHNFTVHGTPTRNIEPLKLSVASQLNFRILGHLFQNSP